MYTFETATNGWGVVTKSQQDHAGEVDGEPDVEYAYEEIGAGSAKNVRLDKITYPNSREVYYNYPSSGIGSALNRLDNIAANGTPTDAQKYAAYTYLGVATVVRVAYPAVTDGSSRPLTLTYDPDKDASYGGFDKFGRVVDQKWENDTPATKDRYRYGYDAASNRTWRENMQTSGKDEFYTYDGLNRLTGYSRGDLTGNPYSGVDTGTDVRREAWGLDQLGNWLDYQIDANADGNFTDAADLDQDRTHNDANEIHHSTYGSAITEQAQPAQGQWIDPAHDLAGNMKLAPRPGDEADADEGLLCVYDAWNRLTKVYKDDGGTSGAWDATDTLIVTHSYDGRHRRIRKLVEGSPDVTYDYYYNAAWQVLEVRKNESSDPDPLKQYVWGIRYIDAPIVRFRDTNQDTNVDDTLYFCNDANMNVTALVNTSGTVVERCVYDPYGKVKFYDGNWANASDTSSYDNEILYCGYRFDPETGLYHVRRRPYHPTLGRWTVPDHVMQYIDGMNLYAYVNDSPVEYVDPFGLATLQIDQGTWGISKHIGEWCKDHFGDINFNDLITKEELLEDLRNLTSQDIFIYLGHSGRDVIMHESKGFVVMKIISLIPFFGQIAAYPHMYKFGGRPISVQDILNALTDSGKNPHGPALAILAGCHSCGKGKDTFAKSGTKCFVCIDADSTVNNHEIARFVNDLMWGLCAAKPPRTLQEAFDKAMQNNDFGKTVTWNRGKTKEDIVKLICPIYADKYLKKKTDK